MSEFGQPRLLPYRNLTPVEQSILNKGTLFPTPSLLLWSALPNHEHRALIWSEAVFDLLFASTFVALGSYFQSTIFSFSHAAADGIPLLFFDFLIVVAALWISVWLPATIFQNRLGSATVSHTLISFALLVPALLFAINLSNLDASSSKATSLLAPGYGEGRSLITIALAQAIFLTRLILFIVFLFVKRTYTKKERAQRASRLTASGLYSHPAGGVSSATPTTGGHDQHDPDGDAIINMNGPTAPQNMKSYAFAQLLEHATAALPSLLLLVDCPILSNFPRFIFISTLCFEPLANFCYAYVLAPRYSTRINHHRLQIRHGFLFFFALLFLLSPLMLTREVASASDRAVATNGASVHGKVASVDLAYPSKGTNTPVPDTYAGIAAGFAPVPQRPKTKGTTALAESHSPTSSERNLPTNDSSQVTFTTRLMAPTASVFSGNQSNQEGGDHPSPRSATTENDKGLVAGVKRKLRELDDALADIYHGWSALFHTFAALLLISALIGGLGALYLSADAGTAEQHAMKRNFFARVLWYFAHPIVVFSLIILASSLTQLAELESGRGLRINPDIRSVASLTGGQTAGALVAENPALLTKTIAAMDIAASLFGPSAASIAKTALSKSFSDDFRDACHGLMLGALATLILALYGIRILHSRTSLRDLAKSLAEDQSLQRLGTAGWTFEDFRPPQEIRLQHERAQRLVLPVSKIAASYLFDFLNIGLGMALIILSRHAFLASYFQTWSLADFTIFLTIPVVVLIITSLLHNVFMANVLRGLLDVNASLAQGPATLERKYGRDGEEAPRYSDPGCCKMWIPGSGTGDDEVDSESSTPNERTPLTGRGSSRARDDRSKKHCQPSCSGRLRNCKKGCVRSWFCCFGCRPLRWVFLYLLPCQCWGRNRDGSWYIIGCRTLAEEDEAAWAEEDAVEADSDFMHQQQFEDEEIAHAQLQLTPADKSMHAAHYSDQYNHPYLSRTGSDGLGSLYGALGDAYGRRDDVPGYYTQTGKRY